MLELPRARPRASMTMAAQCRFFSSVPEERELLPDMELMPQGRGDENGFWFLADMDWEYQLSWCDASYGPGWYLSTDGGMKNPILFNKVDLSGDIIHPPSQRKVQRLCEVGWSKGCGLGEWVLVRLSCGLGCPS